ncbi:MAG: tetratricopeptide repeat protein, partial [Pseudomonadota bacterium]
MAGFFRVFCVALAVAMPAANLAFAGADAPRYDGTLAAADDAALRFEKAFRQLRKTVDATCSTDTATTVRPKKLINLYTLTPRHRFGGTLAGEIEGAARNGITEVVDGTDLTLRNAQADVALAAFAGMSEKTAADITAQLRDIKDTAAYSVILTPEDAAPESGALRIGMVVVPRRGVGASVETCPGDFTSVPVTFTARPGGHTFFNDPIAWMSEGSRLGWASFIIGVIGGLVGLWRWLAGRREPPLPPPPPPIQTASTSTTVTQRDGGTVVGGPVENATFGGMNTVDADKYARAVSEKDQATKDNVALHAQFAEVLSENEQLKALLADVPDDLAARESAARAEGDTQEADAIAEAEAALARNDYTKAEVVYAALADKKRDDLLPVLRKLGAVQAVTNVSAARDTFRQIVTLAPDDFEALLLLGDMEIAFGDVAAAGEVFARSVLDAEQRQNDIDRSRALDRSGRAEVAAGRLAAAAGVIGEALTISRRNAEQYPADKNLQANLAIGHGQLGDVLRGQGDGAGAERAYRDGLAIFERLAASDPTNTEWQRDLFVSWSNIGDVLSAQGDGAGAERAYRDGLAIAERLATSDTTNVEWQRDLSVSWERIGDVLRAQGDGAGAERAYRDGLAIRRRLAASDPTNAEWQRDLSVSWNKIGDVLSARGDGAGAERAYRYGLAIRERLAASDPTNAEWQRDLAISFERVGDIAAGNGDDPAAIEAFERALKIYAALVERQPDDHQARVFSVVPHMRLANLKGAEGKTHVEAALGILKPLAAEGRLDAKRNDWIPELEAQLRFASRICGTTENTRA